MAFDVVAMATKQQHHVSIRIAELLALKTLENGQSDTDHLHSRPFAYANIVLTPEQRF